MSRDGIIVGGTLTAGGAVGLAVALRRGLPLLDSLTPTRSIEAAKGLATAVEAAEPYITASTRNARHILAVLPDKPGMMDMLKVPGRINPAIHEATLDKVDQAIAGARSLRISLLDDAAAAAVAAPKMRGALILGAISGVAAVLGASLVLASLFDS